MEEERGGIIVVVGARARHRLTVLMHVPWGNGIGLSNGEE